MFHEVFHLSSKLRKWPPLGPQNDLKIDKKSIRNRYVWGPGGSWGPRWPQVDLKMGWEHWAVRLGAQLGPQVGGQVEAMLPIFEDKTRIEIKSDFKALLGRVLDRFWLQLGGPQCIEIEVDVQKPESYEILWIMDPEALRERSRRYQNGKEKELKMRWQVKCWKS